MSHYALVPAAGSGARMGGETPKQYLPLAGHALIWHTLSTLCATPAIRKVFVVLSPDDVHWPRGEMAALGDKLVVLRCGGATRAASVANGLREMSPHVDGNGEEWVLVHDAARPCLTVAMVESLISAVGEDDAGGILAMPLADTLKKAFEREDDVPPRIAHTLPREGLWQAQTPQMFRRRMLLEALDFAPQVTDEASAIEALGLKPRLVEGEIGNLKVTWPRDLRLAELILASRERQA